jgi:hypothetical protein
VQKVDTVRVRLHEGRLRCKVTKVQEKIDNQGKAGSEA